MLALVASAGVLAVGNVDIATASAIVAYLFLVAGVIVAFVVYFRESRKAPSEQSSTRVRFNKPRI